MCPQPLIKFLNRSGLRHLDKYQDTSFQDDIGWATWTHQNAHLSFLHSAFMRLYPMHKKLKFTCYLCLSPQNVVYELRQWPQIPWACILSPSTVLHWISYLNLSASVLLFAIWGFLKYLLWWLQKIIHVRDLKQHPASSKSSQNVGS